MTKQYYGAPISMSLKDADITEVLRSLARISGLNIVIQPGVAGPVTVELESVPWDQALDQILKINQLGMELEGNILRIAPVARLAQEAEEQQRLQAAKSLSLPLTTVMRRVSYASASEIAGILQRGRGGTGLMSQRASVIVDDRTNTLIIQELPAFMDQVISIIENLDIPEDQVMIEARIVETTKNWSRSLGFEWNFEGVADAAHGNTTGLVFPNNISGPEDGPTATGGASLLTGGANGFLNIGLGNILNTFELDVVLQAAENEGLVNVISAPKVATLNNERASIQSGLQIPVQTVANNTVTVQFVNATLRLDVTPHITAEGTVLLEINIQKREPQQGLAIVGAPSRSDRDPRRAHPRAGARRRHRGDRRHLRGVDRRVPGPRAGARQHPDPRAPVQEQEPVQHQRRAAHLHHSPHRPLVGRRNRNMRQAARTALVLALLLSALGCDSRLEQTDGGGVLLSVSDFDGLPTVVSVSGARVRRSGDRFGRLISSIARDIDGDTSDLMNVEMQSYEVTFTRGDGGTRVPPPLVRNIFGVTPVGGTQVYENLPVMLSDQINKVPLEDLFLENGGFDKETDRTNIILNISLRFFGRSIAGEAVDTAPVRFTVEFVP